jgi:hypothetical protein
VPVQVYQQVPYPGAQKKTTRVQVQNKPKTARKLKEKGGKKPTGIRRKFLYKPKTPSKLKYRCRFTDKSHIQGRKKTIESESSKQT